MSNVIKFPLKYKGEVSLVEQEINKEYTKKTEGELEISFEDNLAIIPEKYKKLYEENKKDFVNSLFDKNSSSYITDFNYFFKDTLTKNEYKGLFYSLVNDLYSYAKKNFIKTHQNFSEVSSFYICTSYTLIVKYKDFYYVVAKISDEVDRISICRERNIKNINKLDYIDFDNFINGKKDKKFYDNIKFVMEEYINNFKEELNIEDELFLDILNNMIEKKKPQKSEKEKSG